MKVMKYFTVVIVAMTLGLVRTAAEEKKAAERATKFVEDFYGAEKPSIFRLRTTGMDEEYERIYKKFLKEEYAKVGVEWAKIYEEGGTLAVAGKRFIDALKALAGNTKKNADKLDKQLAKIRAGIGFGDDDAPEVPKRGGGISGGKILTDALRRIGGYAGAGGFVADQIPKQQLSELKEIRKATMTMAKRPQTFAQAGITF